MMSIFDELPEVENIAKDVAPGDVLLRYMESFKIALEDVGAEIGLSIATVDGIIKGDKINTISAKAFGDYFGTSVYFWMNLQDQYDRELDLNINK